MENEEFEGVLMLLRENERKRDGERQRPCRDKSTVARRKWDAAHLRSLGCKVNPDTAARFKAMCDSAGITRYKALQWCVECLLKTYGW